MRTLVQPALESLYAYWSGLAAATQGSIVNTPELFATHSNIDWSVCNAVFRFNWQKLVNGQLHSELQSAFPEKKLKLSFWCEKHHSDEAKKIFTAPNYLHFGYIPVMVAASKPIFTKPHLPGIEIISATDPKHLDEWMKPLNEAFAIAPNVAPQLQAALENMSDTFHVFAAVKDNQIIGTGGVFTAGEMAGLYNLSVAPEYRKQGIATAMHYHRLQYANQLGYEYVTLQATPMATQLDKSLGFVEVTGFDVYAMA